jgi:outer membrane protein OmpA-like peptidoglycan-associated protein
MLVLLGGCSSVPNAVNPIAWYRDLTGASKNDALDQNQPNQKNLDAGSKAPYPNLASVPDAPDTALATIDRDKLRQSLVADRENAKYTADQLHAGMAVAGTAPPPVAAAVPRESAPATGAPPAAASASAAPEESPLVSPSVRSVPQGETPAPAPPPPAIPRSPVAAAPLPAPSAPPSPGARRAAPASSVEVATIAFDGSTASLSDSGKSRLSEIAAMQHQQGGALRVIGHAAQAGSDDAMQRQLAAFDLALARARAVAHELSAEGVPAASIAVEAASRPAGAGDAASALVYLEH